MAQQREPRRGEMFLGLSALWCTSISVLSVVCAFLSVLFTADAVGTGLCLVAAAIAVGATLNAMLRR